MARLPRLAVAALPHLVLLRGQAQHPIVHDDVDRQACIDAVREASTLQRLAVHAYALLDDRIRLLVTPPTAAAMGKAIQDFGRRYVASFNRRHGHRGTLWDGRYRATVVQPGHWALQAMVFVDTEAVRLGWVGEAGEHRWSSAGHHLGRHRDPLVSHLADYWQLGNTPFERESAYSKHLSEGVSEADAMHLAQACHKGWAMGERDYLEALAKAAPRPIQPRPRGRPAKPRKA